MPLTEFDLTQNLMIKKQEGEIIINKQFFIHIKKNVTSE